MMISNGSRWPFGSGYFTCDGSIVIAPTSVTSPARTVTVLPWAFFAGSV